MEDAVQALDDFISEEEHAVEMGLIEDAYDREEFRIVEVV
jgi:hypothetical protein